MTDQQREKLINAVESGATRDAAAAIAAVHVSTLHRWLAKGEDPDDDPRYGEFREQVKTAELVSKGRAELLITKHARTTWQAAAWQLERRYPQEYGRLVRTEVSGPQGGPIRVDDNVSRGIIDDPVLAAQAQALYLAAVNADVVHEIDEE